MSSSSLFASLGAALNGLPAAKFSFKGSNSHTKVDPKLAAFESELNVRLEQLKSTDESAYLSISWLCRSMEIVFSTHASAQLFATDLRQALARGENRLLDEYLDHSVILLDTCLTLKEAIAEIKRYCVHVGLALRALNKGTMGGVALRRCTKELNKCKEILKRRDDVVNHLGQRRSKLENCSSMLRRMGERLNSEDAMKGNFFMVMYCVQVCTIFVCGLLSSALSFKPRRSLSSMCIGGQSPWSVTLSTLQQRVKDQVEKKKSKGATALLEEIERTDVEAQNLYIKAEKMVDDNSFPLRKGKIAEIKGSAKLLHDSFLALQQGLIPLESNLEEIYRILLESRIALLDIYSNL